MPADCRVISSGIVFVNIYLDLSRSISGEIFLTHPTESRRLRICNFIPEPFPPHVNNWILAGVQSIRPQVINDFIASYFQSAYLALPIVEEQIIMNMFRQFVSDRSPERLVQAIVYGFVALSANYGRDRDLAEWCYGFANNALSSEPNDAQFEYLLACTLLVSLHQSLPSWV